MMDNIDVELLAHIRKRTNYENLKDVVTKGMCTKESWTLVNDFGRYFDTHPTLEDIDDDFKLWMRVSGHPGWKPDQHSIYTSIIDRVLSHPGASSESFLEQLTCLRANAKLQQRKGTGGISSYSELQSFIEELDSLSERTSSDNISEGYSLEQIALSSREKDAYYWRLEDLNRSIGPISKGDLVIVAKRPETGGTSFLVSEMSYILEQMPNTTKAVLFNNEEAPDKVYSRMVSATLNIDYRTLMSAPALYQDRYNKWLDGRSWDLEHDTGMTVSSVRKKLKENEYDLIGINVLLKVGGTGKKEDHDKFQYLGEELRRISQTYGPVIAIVQADPTAEGQQYIPQDRIYKSKTALQGEADVLIMIGKDDMMSEDVRYIHVAKNKIPPAACTVPALKHIKSQVEFDIGTGRFTSVNFIEHSSEAKI